MKKKHPHSNIKTVKIRFNREFIIPQAQLLTNLLQFAMSLKISLILVSRAIQS